MRLITAALGVAILAMVGFLASQSMHPTAKPQVAAAEVSQMPAGITFQIVAAQNAMSAMGAFKGYPVITNEKHRTIYTTDNDTVPGKSSCTGDCAKDWLPLAAPADAKPSGFWGVIARDDGTKQWTRHGKPLYTYAQDKNAGDIKGASVESWHWVLNNAMYGTPLPDGIVTEEMVAAGGQAFVDSKGRTLYTFTGDIKNDKVACAPGATCDNGPAHWAHSRRSRVLTGPSNGLTSRSRFIPMTATPNMAIPKAARSIRASMSLWRRNTSSPRTWRSVSMCAAWIT
jgi:predicted lipoprotein with Yx(FWY)xxD motif